MKETFHFPKDLALRIPGREGTTCEGTVTDLRTGGGRRWVLAEFPPPGTPLLTIGEPMALLFTGPCLPREFTCVGEVALWSFNDAAFTYGFQVDRVAKESLMRAIHLHRAQRIEFSVSAPLTLRVATSPGGEVFEGRLENLSVGGLGALLSRTGDRTLKSGYELEISFELPDGEGTIDLLGRARWRSSVGEQVHYGIQFVSALTPEAQAELQRIERFVASRDSGQ